MFTSLTHFDVCICSYLEFTALDTDKVKPLTSRDSHKIFQRTLTHRRQCYLASRTTNHSPNVFAFDDEQKELYTSLRYSISTILR